MAYWWATVTPSPRHRRALNGVEQDCVAATQHREPRRQSRRWGGVEDISVVDEKSRDRKFLNEDGTREGEKGLTKSRRLELLAFSGIRQELGQRRLGDIRSVREVVGAVVIEIQQDQSRLALRWLDITQSDDLLGNTRIFRRVEEQRI